MIAGTPIATLGQSLAAEARVRWLLAHPPALSDGQLEVLRHLGPDLTLREWSRRFCCTIRDIERAEVWLNIKCKREVAP